MIMFLDPIQELSQFDYYYRKFHGKRKTYR